MQLRLQLGHLLAHPHLLQAREDGAHVAADVAGGAQRLHGELADQRAHPRAPRRGAHRLHPLRPAQARGRAPGRPHGCVQRGVGGVAEHVLGQRVEHRSGGGRLLQGGLEHLALRPEPGVARLRPRGARVDVHRAGHHGGAAPGRGARLPHRLADPLHHRGRLVPADPAGELGGVLVAQRAVLDLGDHGHGALECGHPPLGGVQVVLGQQRLDGEGEHRAAPGHQVAHRAVTGGDPQLAGVHPVGGDRDEGLRGELLVAVEGLEGCGLPRLVAVEGEDDLAAVEVVVHEQPAQQLHVRLAEGGAAGGHRGGHPRQLHRHHVGVALDDDGLVPLLDLPLGQVEPEQHLGLLVQHRVRGVDVLRLEGVVVEQAPGAETDHVTAEVAQRPEQAPVEPVDRAALALLADPGGDELGDLEPLAHQDLRQGVPPRGGVAAAEGGRRRGVEAALGEVGAGRLGLGFAELRGVELLGGGVHRDQPGPGAAVALDAGAPALVGQRVAHPLGQALDGLHEAEVLHLLDELDGVAALAAAEAVVVAVRRTHVERRRLLVVEGAQALERAPAGRAQRDVLADDLLDAGALADLRDVPVRDASSHAAESRPPPRRHGRGRDRCG